jgi:hypothetical protein
LSAAAIGRPVYAVHSGCALTLATGLALHAILSDSVLASAGRLAARTPSAQTGTLHCITAPSDY